MAQNTTVMSDKFGLYVISGGLYYGNHEVQ